MAITASMVKELREMTGAGMMDCKKALTATEGDMDKAVDFLREKGLAGAQKKAGRIAAEGIVATCISEDEKHAVVGEMWLTHFSPSLIRPDEYMDKVREIFPNSYPGKDGKSVELNFEED